MRNSRRTTRRRWPWSLTWMGTTITASGLRGPGPLAGSFLRLANTHSPSLLRFFQWTEKRLSQRKSVSFLGRVTSIAVSQEFEIDAVLFHQHDGGEINEVL